MKTPTNKSKLDQLASKIRSALGRDTKNPIEIGKYLIESRDELDYGDWLGWLKENFDLSRRSAYRNISAARFAETDLKFATVANLARSVLYALAEGRYSSEEKDAILAATREGRVDTTRAAAICQSLKTPAPTVNPAPPADNIDDDANAVGAGTEKIQDGSLPAASLPAASPPAASPPAASPPAAAIADSVNDADAEDADSKKILDGPPPDVPPPAPIAPPNFAMRSFDQTVNALKQLMTKPAADFDSTTHSAGDLEVVARFIQDVADQARKRRSPNNELTKNPASQESTAGRGAN
jgi:hypothetical protein